MESHGKNILIIVENLPLPFDRRVWQEANTLAEEGYGVYIICPKGEKEYSSDYECINGIHIYRHDMPLEAEGPFGYLVEYISALKSERKLIKKIFKTVDIDAIQACNPPDLIYLVVKPFKKKHNLKFVFDHHDINPELYIAKFNRKDFFYKLLKYVERQTFKLCDRSIATNESYKQIAIDRGKIEPEKIHVVRSGPSLERVYKVETDNSLKKGKDYLIAYVGVIGQQEGISYLLKSIHYMVTERKRDDIHCIIMGSGPDLENMQKECTKLGIESFVEFPGRVPDDYLRAVLSSCDVCINPDEYNEMNDKSTMNKIMEYMAFGKPIVQFDLKEGRFSARDASLYAEKNNSIDMAKKIIWLLDNPEEREKMGVYGHKRVIDELQWTIEAPKYLNVYKTLFSE